MKILFVKTSSLGDVVHQCPAVSDAARKIARAQIDWVVEESFAGVVRMHASVQRVIPVAIRRWRRSFWRSAVWQEIADFRKAVAVERYDAVVDTQGLLKSALLTRFTSGTRHGMDRSSAREAVAARFYDRTYDVPRGLHAVDRNRRLTAAALGFSFDPAVHYGLRPQALKSQGGAYAVLLTMTSRADKLWPESRWIELVRRLALPVVLPWGSAEERERAERIGRGTEQAVVPQRMSIEALAEVLANGQCVVGLDSGLTHLAAALGRPTVAIFCGSDPALTGLYGAPRARNLGMPGEPPEVDEVLQSLR